MRTRWVSLLASLLVLSGLMLPGRAASEPVGLAPLSPPELPTGLSPADRSAGKDLLAELQHTQAGPFLGDVDGNKLLDNLDAALAGADPARLLPVVVLTRVPPDQSVLYQLRRRAGDFATKYVWDRAVLGFAADLLPGQIMALAQESAVAQLELDGEVFAAGAVEQARLDFGATGSGDGSAGSYTGRDMNIAVLDTGIDPSHRDLDGGKVLAFVDYVAGRTTPYDDNGHGTFVAGVAAGQGDADPARRGVAPGAGLLVAKVLDAGGRGSTSRVIAGINWTLFMKNNYNVRVLLLPLSSPYRSDGRDALSRALDRAAAAGVLPVVAAGNDGPAPGTVHLPASAAGALAVGAVADPHTGGWLLPFWSGRGGGGLLNLKPELVAPGYRLAGAMAGNPTGYASFSGTSGAAAFTAGVAALMASGRPTLTAADLRRLLLETAQDWGVPGHDPDYGWGLIQPYQAVQAAGGFAGGAAPAGPHHGGAQGTLDSPGSRWYTLTVADPDTPLALALLLPGWQGEGSADADLYLYGPDGALLAWSVGRQRSETISILGGPPGPYYVEVRSLSGDGGFRLDASWR